MTCMLAGRFRSTCWLSLNLTQVRARLEETNTGARYDNRISDVTVLIGRAQKAQRTQSS